MSLAAYSSETNKIKANSNNEKKGVNFQKAQFASIHLFLPVSIKYFFELKQHCFFFTLECQFSEKQFDSLVDPLLNDICRENVGK